MIMEKNALSNSSSMARTYQLRELCRQLDKNNISFFQYQRFYFDGSVSFVSSDEHWSYSYLSNKLYNKSELLERSQCRRQQIETIVPCSCLNSGQFLCQYAIREFNIGNGITITEQDNEGINFYMFGGNINHNLLSYYFNNLNHLWRFIYFFKDQGQALIEEINQERYILDNLKRCKYKHKRCSHKHNSVCDDAMPINKYHICDGDTQCNISKRVVECVYWLAHGKTTCEIACILGISKKTVEKHLEVAKCKMQCYKQSELIRLFMEKNLLH